MKYLASIIIVAALIYISFFAGVWIDSKIYWPKHQPYYFENEPEEINFESDGLKLSANFYSPDSDSFPLVIIVHGLTGEGKDFDLYEIIANELVKSGFGTLNIDMRGFNKSEDPIEINSYDDFDLGKDVLNAIRTAVTLPGVDTSKMFLLGHSMGAGVVLSAVNPDLTGKIKGVVSIEPDRRGRDIDTVGFAERLTKDMKLNYLFNPGVTETLEKMTNTFYLSEKMNEHPPILFVESEQAVRHDLFLKDYELFSEPKAYIVIPDTYHYFGTKFGDNWGKKKALLKFLRLIPGTPDAIINVNALSILLDHLIKFFDDPYSVTEA